MTLIYKRERPAGAGCPPNDVTDGPRNWATSSRTILPVSRKAPPTEPGARPVALATAPRRPEANWRSCHSPRSRGRDRIAVNAPVRWRSVRVSRAGHIIRQHDRAQNIRCAAAVVEQRRTINGVKICAGRRAPIQRHALVAPALPMASPSGGAEAAGQNASARRRARAPRRIRARADRIYRLHHIIIRSCRSPPWYRRTLRCSNRCRIPDPPRRW